MKYNALKVDYDGPCCHIQFDRQDSQNSINAELVAELHYALDLLEDDLNCRVIVLSGGDGVFCTGMDLEEIVSNSGKANKMSDREFTRLYSLLLKRMTTTSKIVIAKVDGQVVAGGLGFVAASDLVVCTPRTRFSLSEALWGLLPSMVIPYLIRKVGFQLAYKMTLTTLPIGAEEAHKARLVDDISDSPDQVIAGHLQRMLRIDEKTIKHIKNYFRTIWMITDEMERYSAGETERLMSSPEVVGNIFNFVTYKRFPWEQSKSDKDAQ